MRYGAVLRSVAGRHVCSLAELGAAIDAAGPSSTLVVERDGRMLELELRMEPAPVKGD